MREYWLKCETGSFWHCNEKSFLKHDVPQYRKYKNLSRKCITSLIHRQNHTQYLTEAGFVFLLDKHVLNVSLLDWCARIRLQCAHFLIRKGIFDWKHALKRLRSHEHSIEHIDGAITFSRRCNYPYKELIQN